MHRPILVAVAAISMSVVALATEAPREPLWKRVPAIGLNCVSHDSRAGEPVDQNVVLDAKFEAALVSQLHSSATGQSPYCWYETPNGSLRLWIGGLCGDVTEAKFEKVEKVWKLTSEWPTFVTCK